MDETKMMEFLGRAVGDVGAVLGGAMVMIGDKLGLYQSMAGAGSDTPAEVADRTCLLLASAWIPALDGVEGKLTAGARIADVGCRHGASTLLLAEAYPESTVVGFDAEEGSVDAARKPPATPDSPTECALMWPRPRRSPGAMTSCACSIACTTWVTRPVCTCSGPPRPRWDAHAHRAGPERRRLFDAPVHAQFVVPRGRRGTGRPGRRGSTPRDRHRAGFTTLKRVAETPFKIVLEGKA